MKHYNVDAESKVEQLPEVIRVQVGHKVEGANLAVRFVVVQGCDSLGYVAYSEQHEIEAPRTSAEFCEVLFSTNVHPTAQVALVDALTDAIPEASKEGYDLDCQLASGGAVTISFSGKTPNLKMRYVEQSTERIDYYAELSKIVDSGEDVAF